jgi:hypothetical protein
MIDFPLHGSPPRQQFLPPGLEPSREFQQEGAGIRRKNAGFDLGRSRGLGRIVLKNSHGIHKSTS